MTEQSKLSPIVYRCMLEHWQDNQVTNCISRVNPFWNRHYGVNYPEGITITKKEFTIGKS